MHYFKVYFITRVTSQGALLSSIKQESGSQVTPFEHSTNNLQGERYKGVLCYISIQWQSLKTSLEQTL